MKLVSADAAVSVIPRGARIVASPGCGSPTSLLRAVARMTSTVPDLHLFSGLQLDYSPFIDAVRGGDLDYSTWHVLGEMRDVIHEGRANYVPARASEIPSLLSAWGVTVALVRVSPPDDEGFHSLGPTGSYPIDAVNSCPLVIAEVDDSVPHTFGNRFHGSRVTAFTSSEHPMPVYEAAVETEVSRLIAELVMPYLKSESTIQIGIGSIPEAILSSISRSNLGDIRFAGMGCDLMVEMFDNGQISASHRHPDAAIHAVELMGGPILMSFAHENPSVAVVSSRHGHSAVELSSQPRFTSINSAIEIDLWGQVNAETIASRQVSGVGGSVDFTEAAYQSQSGLRIIALPSTVRNGAQSCIVPRLPAGSAVTIPRSMTQLVVTEFGVADLRGTSTRERAELLISIAHPDHRDALTTTLTETERGKP